MEIPLILQYFTKWNTNMDKRNMRIGDFVRDPMQNEKLIVTLNEIECSELFEGIPLTKKFFDKNGFAVDTAIRNEVLYKQDREIFVTAEDKGAGKWFVQVRHGNMTFAGEIFTVHHFQHLLNDCLIFWKILI